MADVVDLPEALRARIGELFGRLEELTHYELLGVPRSADRKAIKSAYYGLAAEFHPDKYYGQNLGDLRGKLERIFTRVTLAHDVLSHEARRAEYDETLGATLGFAAPPEPAPPPATPDPPPAAGPPPAPAAPLVPDRPDDEVRRARALALARKLGGARPPAPRAEATPPPPGVDPKQAAVALKNRFDAKQDMVRSQQVSRLREKAILAEAAGRWEEATLAIRQAAAADPADDKLKADVERLERAAATALADRSRDLAEQAGRAGRWGEAAQLWAKVCLGRPGDASAHNRAAQALVRASLDPRRTVLLARRAVELDPTRAMYRVTLARAYVAANLPQSAEAELQRALQQGAGQADVVAAVQEVRKELK